MKDHAAIFWRGFLIVALTASNISQVAQGYLFGSFINSFLISFVWWRNSHRAAHSNARFGQWAYGLGAGSGAVFGMLIVRIIYGTRP